MLNRFDKINDENFIMIFNESESKSEIIRKLNLPENGTSIRYVNKMVEKLGLSLDTLKQNHYNKYHLKKICTVCGKEFNTPNYESDKVCCSYACSNTYFRSGENNGMFKGRKEIFDSLSEADKQKYLERLDNRKKRQEKIREEHKKRNIKHKEHIEIGFRYHPHKCCVCGEEKIVAIHHYDGNHFNNEPSNLVPLCPTHHSYMHSKYKDEIIDIVNEYVKKFKESFIFNTVKS